MSDNFHKFLFLGVMLVLAVFANNNTGSKGAMNQGADVLAQNTAEKRISAISVGLPPQVAASDSYMSAMDAAPVSEKTDAVAIVVKGISGVGQDTYLPGASSTDAPLSQDIKPREPAGSFLGSEAAGANRSVFYRISDEPPPAIGAKIVLIADLRSDEVFYGLNPAMRWPLASVTKLMTAEIIYKNNLLNQSTTITEAEFAVDGSTEDLKIGERYSLADLTNAMLIESNNESAMALADFYGYDAFMGAMNDEAKNLGLDNAYFSDPVGLSAANQSTANDLLAFSRRIYTQYPEIFKITRKISVSLKELNSLSRITVKNINEFAGRADFLGGKTGYTGDASGNLLSIFSYQKQPIFIIVMGTEDRFGDTKKLLEWFERNYK